MRGVQPPVEIQPEPFTLICCCARETPENAVGRLEMPAPFGEQPAGSRAVRSMNQDIDVTACVFGWCPEKAPLQFRPLQDEPAHPGLFKPVDDGAGTALSPQGSSH